MTNEIFYRGDEVCDKDSTGEFTYIIKEIYDVNQEPWAVIKDGKGSEPITRSVAISSLRLIHRSKCYYGNWIMGEWSCSCGKSYYPRELWEMHLEAPFKCPACGCDLFYDEAA